MALSDDELKDWLFKELDGRCEFYVDTKDDGTSTAAVALGEIHAYARMLGHAFDVDDGFLQNYVGARTEDHPIDWDDDDRNAR